MGLDSLLTSFQSLCNHPLAWLIVALLAAKTLSSLYHFLHCPLAGRKLKRIDAAAADAMVQRRFLHSPRFLVLTLVGLTLAIGGLYGLGDARYGGYALAAMIMGLFLLIVEPSQLSIEENQLRVMAAGARDAETLDLAEDRLRMSHFERIGLEAGLTLIVAALVAFY